MTLIRKLFKPISYSVLLILSHTACSDEEIFKKAQCDDQISFAVEYNSIETITRGITGNEIYPTLGLQVNEKDSLYFHTDVSIIKTSNELAETRGFIIDNENIDKLNDITIDAYVRGNTPYFIKYPITKQNNGNIWKGTTERYWPENKSEKLEFYASAMVPVDMNLTHSDGKTTAHYTVPNSGETNRDAEVQPDIMFGYAKCSYEDVKANSGNVPLNMRHALAAISFEVADFRGGTIKKITIRNARKSGAITYSETNYVTGSTPVINWKLDEVLTDFTQIFDIEVEDGVQTGVTSQTPKATFMLLPQDIESDEVMFEVELEVNENNEKKTYILTAQAVQAGDITNWEAGKHYTYILSSSSINWTYVFELGQNSIILENGNQNGEVNLISYRYRTGNPQKKEEWPWKAEGGTAQDVTSTSVLNAADWIEQLNKNGTGSISGEIWKISVKPNRLIDTNFKGDEILRNNPVRGTAESPWDLSTHKYGETSIETTISQSTANCYVVNSAGRYCFPAVYGNGYNGGKINTKALNKHSSITKVSLQYRMSMMPYFCGKMDLD